ncbi:MAG: hypothetical protein ACK2U1_06525 [Anaerolineales bacterium]
MKTYKLLEIRWGRVDIKSTDIESIKWIINEITQIIPSCRATQINQHEIKIDKLDGRDTEMVWFAMEKLCESGWQPFAISETGGGGTQPIHLESYHFRKEVEV